METKTKPTPGPLAMEIGEECCFHEGNRVAITRTILEDGEQHTETVAEVWRTCDDSDIADGYLFATAPELLAAAKALLPFVKRHRCVFHGPMTCDTCVALKQTAAAIAKAKGEATPPDPAASLPPATRRTDRALLHRARRTYR